MWRPHQRARTLLPRTLFIFIAGLLLSTAVAQAQEVKSEVFLPDSGKGPVVVVASGASGTKPYRELAAKLAGLGYYTVLMEGKDLLDIFNPRNEQGASNLAKVIAQARSAPQALPGKVALVGFSLGGAGVLLHGTPLQEAVSAVVAFYPAVSRLGLAEAELAARFRTPVLLLAAEKDEQNNCCKIESMRAIAAAAKGATLDLVVYPEAGHGFNLNLPPFVYRADDAADAWAKTVAFLARQHSP